MNVLLDTNVLCGLSRVVTACSQPARTPELSFGIQRLADGRRKERFRSYLQNLRRLTGCSYPTGSLRYAPPQHPPKN